jgi:hypothetical protein
LASLDVQDVMGSHKANVRDVRKIILRNGVTDDDFNDFEPSYEIF